MAFCGIIITLTNSSKESPVITMCISIFFCIVAFVLLRQPKNEEVKIKQPIPDIQIDNNDIISETNVEPVDSTTDIATETYVETENMIYRVDGQSISDEEIPYLIEVGKQRALEQYKQTPTPAVHRITHEEFIIKRTIPQIIKHIQESYEIMYNTDNPETLCERYKFSLKTFEELCNYQKQGYFNDNAKINTFDKMLSTDNYVSLIYQCYKKYISKAQHELKTQKGINNRIDKFWKIIQDNVDTNVYSKLQKPLK